MGTRSSAPMAVRRNTSATGVTSATATLMSRYGMPQITHIAANSSQPRRVMAPRVARERMYLRRARRGRAGGARRRGLRRTVGRNRSEDDRFTPAECGAEDGADESPAGPPSALTQRAPLGGADHEPGGHIMAATLDTRTEQESGTTPDPRRWKALGVLALIQFMLVLDVTVVNVALPHIQHDLGFSRSGLAWVVNGYVLMAGGFLLLGGRMADILGRRRLFLVGVGLFAAASATCGAAVVPGMLVASRFVQGLGEALAAPASLGLIAVLFSDPKERMRALGVWGGIAGLGGTTGTVISGTLVDLASWRWIFLINLPVAAFALLVVPRLVSESRMVRDRRRPDFAGAVTGTAGLVGVVDGLLAAATHDWTSWQVLLPLAGGVALLAVMVLIESRSDAPLIPLTFFENRTRVVTNFVTLFFASSFFSYFFLLTLFEQQIMHWNPLRGGLS